MWAKRRRQVCECRIEGREVTWYSEPTSGCKPHLPSRAVKSLIEATGTDQLEACCRLRARELRWCKAGYLKAIGVSLGSTHHDSVPVTADARATPGDAHGHHDADHGRTQQSHSWIVHQWSAGSIRMDLAQQPGRGGRAPSRTGGVGHSDFVAPSGHLVEGAQFPWTGPSVPPGSLS